jgi:hypothetical protein
MFVYDDGMDPARHRLAAPDDPALVDRLVAELSRQGEPPITVQRMTVLSFECRTGEFMLRARVADALMTACGHDRWQQLFQPLD